MTESADPIYAELQAQAELLRALPYYRGSVFLDIPEDTENPPPLVYLQLPLEIETSRTGGTFHVVTATWIAAVPGLLQDALEAQHLIFNTLRNGHCSSVPSLAAIQDKGEGSQLFSVPVSVTFHVPF